MLEFPDPQNFPNIPAFSEKSLEIMSDKLKNVWKQHSIKTFNQKNVTELISTLWAMKFFSNELVVGREYFDSS